MKSFEEISELVKRTLIDAGSTFETEKKEAYKKAIAN